MKQKAGNAGFSLFDLTFRFTGGGAQATPSRGTGGYAHIYASTMSFFVLCINAISSSRSGCWILKVSNVA
jgi:hypothetical protein